VFQKLKDWLTGRPTTEQITALIDKYVDMRYTAEDYALLRKWENKGWLPLGTLDEAAREQQARLHRRRVEQVNAARECPTTYDNSVYHLPYLYSGGCAPPEAIVDPDKFKAAAEREGGDSVSAGGPKPNLDEAPAPREVHKPEPEVAPPPREVFRDEVTYSPPPPPPATYDYSPPPPPPPSDYGGSSNYDSGGSSSVSFD
jgi:hypothetical protein